MTTIAKWKIELACVCLLLLILPLTLQISFMQNDDWVYYGMVKSFIAGDFRLADLAAPTFYAQGIPASLFALIFGLQVLPLLTLIVGVISFYIVVKILVNYFKTGFLVAVLLALLLFFNPVSMYSVLGFMSEYYFILYTLTGLYFCLKFEQLNNSRYFLLANIFIIVSFFVRQLGLVLSLAFAGSLLLQKKYKAAAVQVLISCIVYALYMLVFPKTPEMIEKPLSLSKFNDVRYLFSLGYGISIYLAAFCLPVLIAIVALHKRVALKLVLAGLVCFAVFILANKYFEPQKLAWPDFPYLQNTWEQSGLYPRTITGVKYGFIGMTYLYQYWSFMAKFGVGVLLLLPVIKRKLNIFILYLGIYIAVLFVTPEIYDRYLLPLFFVSIFYLISLYPQLFVTKSLKAALIVFLIPLIIYSYQLGLDFVRVNNYIWTRSAELVAKSGVDPKAIKSTNAWKLTYKNPTAQYSYMFNYDSYTAQPDLVCCWKLIETKDLGFTGSIFISPKIYLYQKLQGN